MLFQGSTDLNDNTSEYAPIQQIPHLPWAENKTMEAGPSSYSIAENIEARLPLTVRIVEAKQTKQEEASRRAKRKFEGVEESKINPRKQQQQKVGAKVKLSKANDFYPGTNERVCLTSGSNDAAINSGPVVLEKREKGKRQVKVIVPKSTAEIFRDEGIQQIKETRGSVIQFSQKPSDTTLPERVDSVIRDNESNKAALDMILKKVQEDTQSGSCLNISYSEINGPIANANPTCSFFANRQLAASTLIGADASVPGVPGLVPRPPNALGQAEEAGHGQKAICGGPPVIVPNSTARMISGKGDCTIQQIKETSGSFIQLSQKPSDTTLPERVVTVIGDDDSNKAALDMILNKVQEDPQSGSCLNVSYSEINGPVANANPTGSPFANGQQQLAASASTGAGASVPGVPGPVPRPPEAPGQAEEAGHGQKAICGGPPVEPASLGAPGGGVSLNVPGYSNVNVKLNLQSPQPPSDPRLISQCLPHINLSLRRAGYTEEVADEVTGALGTLSVHGVLQLTPGALTSELSVTTDPVFLPPPPQTPPVNTAANQGPFGPAGLVPAPPSVVTPQQQQPPPPVVTVGHYPPRPASDDVSSLISPGLASIAGGHSVVPPFPPLPVNNNSFGLATAGNPLPPPPVPPAEHGLAKVDIEVSESLVGAVLGPAGRSIIEIQQFSGANIQISKKGMYSPGTRNRIVTVTGSQKAINTAKFLIDLKVQDEESKRQFNAGINIC